MKALLKLRFNRIRRSLRQTPAVALVLLAIFVSGTGYVLFHQFQLTPNKFVIWAVFSFWLFTAHNRRKDIDFYSLMVLRPRRLFVVEYLICFSPPIILAIVTGTWDNLLLYVVSAVCVGSMPRSALVSSLKRLPAFLNIRSLELVSFVKKSFVWILFLSLLASIFSYVPVLSMFLLLVFVLLLSGAYTENEPLDMLLLPEISAAKYLGQKIRAGFVFFLKPGAPALILYAVFNHETAWLSLVVPIVALASISLFVFVKYTGYNTEGTKAAVPLIVSIGMSGIIIPLLLPLMLLLTWKYYYSAKETLNKYLYVYD